MDGVATESRLARAEALYRSGDTFTLVDELRDADAWPLDAESAVRLFVLRGMALFDTGDVVQAIAVLREAVELSRRAPVSAQFSAAFALLVRESDFQAPEEVLPGLSRLRQLASRIGDERSLAGLHLSVARLEGHRGHCVDAHRHLEIARRLIGQRSDTSLQCSLDLVEASLESIAGNLIRSRQLAQACFDRASAADFVKYRIGSATNLAVMALYAGQIPAARTVIQQVLDQASGLTYVQLGALDNLAQIELREDRLDACAALLERCADLIQADRLPARSWYDLAHQLTRCAYRERLGDWAGVVEIVEAADADLERRQFKAVRTSLISAKARALAHLGRHRQAEAALAVAVRACPRGAVDPLIVLEASKATCATRAGDRTRGAVLFERARAASRAIGHRHHEWWIDGMQAALIGGGASAEAPARAPRQAARPSPDPALLLSDVATILGAGHSIDLLVHRTAAILQNTLTDAPLDITSRSGLPFEPELSVAWEAEAGGTFHIRLRGSDRQAVIQVRDVHSIQDISLLKSVVDLVQAAVGRAAEAENEDEDLTLWPRSLVASGEDTVFRSPQMAELVRVAGRLAAAELPVLITGETGTGKEVIARLIHEHSRMRRGPFVAFNCSAVPRDLVESQLFGHRRGSFTGATEAFQGVIRAAEGGTLLLDEIGDLDPMVQPKLLRFLESGEIHPIGEARSRSVRVRILAATNAELEERVERGRFRADLFYRIGAARIALPPLRERKDEIPALASLFASRYGRECERTGLRIGDDLIAALLLYDWPGNIRQLANEIRRVVAMAGDGQTLRSTDLSPEISRAWNARPTLPSAEPAGPTISVRLGQPLASAVDELERQFIDHALQVAGGRVTDAADMLGLSRKGLFLKRRRQGLVGRQP